MSGPGPCVVFALAKDAREAGLLPGADGRWVFLGKDVEERRRIETLFGPSRRYVLAGRLHEVAARLRRPFLDFVSEVGALQRDAIAWWSSAFAWKMWGYSDMFLLVCYLRLAEALVRDASSEGGAPLLIVIEDPWLFRQIGDRYGQRGDARLHGTASLWTVKLRAIALCVMKRGWWLVKTMRNYRRQRLAWGPGPMAEPQQAGAAIYSFPLRRCLTPGDGWHDPFLLNTDAMLQSQGCEVRRFSPPESGGFEGEIAGRRRYFIPLILYATVGALLRSLSAFWRPRWPHSPEIDGQAVRFLMTREWWIELERSSLCVNRMFYECASRMFRRARWKVVVFPYENQPWEKMLCACARQCGVRTVGIQHAIFSVYSMAYFLGSGESTRMPLPDVICASGPYLARLLAEGGTPADRLRMTGSVRYGHLGGAARPQAQRLKPAPGAEILVALPIDPHMTRHLLAAIREAFPSGGVEGGLRFHIKPHPLCPVSEEDIGFPAVRAPDDFQRALESCGLVIFVGSTVGAEAMALGRRVLRYRPELLLNVDPSEVYGEQIPTCGDADFRAVVLAQVAGAEPAGPAAEADSQACTRQIFVPLDREMLAGILCAG